MARFLEFIDSSLGRKYLMALTGLLLFFFLVTHLTGNLTLYGNRNGDDFVAYASNLHGFGLLLYVAEIGLVALFGLHIFVAIRLTLLNRQARPQNYEVKRVFGESTISSRSMIVTGSIILGFLVIHLLNFRLSEGLVAPHADDLFTKYKAVLTDPIFALIYLAGAAAVGVHLNHGFRSLFQSLGINHPRLNAMTLWLARVLAIVLALGFASFPIAALLGFWNGDVS